MPAGHKRKTRMAKKKRAKSTTVAINVNRPPFPKNDKISAPDAKPAPITDPTIVMLDEKTPICFCCVPILNLMHCVLSNIT